MIKSKVSDVMQTVTTDLELRHVLKSGLISYYIPNNEKLNRNTLAIPGTPHVVWNTCVCSLSPPSGFQVRDNMKM